jgi:tellurite methyltransferase
VSARYRIPTRRRRGPTGNERPIATRVPARPLLGRPNSVDRVERTIAGYHQDGDGEWVGELSCGHGQHLRHRPPFQVRPWVLDPAGRTRHRGTAIDCPLCDRAELPEGLRYVGASPLWNDVTMPAGLRTSHQLAPGRWGVIGVRAGRLRFRARTAPPIERVLVPGEAQPIPSEVAFDVEPLGHAQFTIEWFARRSHDAGKATRFADSEGGDPACWAHLICPDCGDLLEGTPRHHNPTT